MIRKSIENSSQIAAFGYDAQTRVLEVEFTQGKVDEEGRSISRVYTYWDVDPADVAAMEEPGVSVGKVFGARIKGGPYSYEWTSSIVKSLDGSVEEVPNVT